jgi:hypothetical protein
MHPIRRIRDLLRELRGDRRHPAPQQETRCGIVHAFLGFPCEFGEGCAYPDLGWRCGHLRQRQYVPVQAHHGGCRTWNTGCDGDCDCRSAR